MLVILAILVGALVVTTICAALLFGAGIFAALAR
jgi:hypothetical protein